MKMGRGNSVATDLEERQSAKSVSMGISLLGNKNNNNNNTRGMKVLSQAKQYNEIILQSGGHVNMTPNSTNKRSHKVNTIVVNTVKHSVISISAKTGQQIVVEQNPHDRTLDNTTAETRNSVFQFWSKINKSNMNSNEGTINTNSKSKKDTVSTISKKLLNYQNISEKNCKRCTINNDSVVTIQTQRKKREELISSNNFMHIDNHVIALSEQMNLENTSVQDVVCKITEKSQNDLEKLRAIWIWLCHNVTYDVDGFLGLSEKIFKPEDVLWTRKGVCSGYASLCKNMCREVGIRCREVAGYSRGTEHNKGHSFHRTKSNHMWNAVELDNQWYLLDACWGAGTVDLQNRIFIPSYDDFFFLTDPEDFIETHWPDDPAWQLLDSKVTFEDFEQKIFKTSEFFRLHLFIVAPNVFHLLTDDGEVTVSLGCSYHVEFSYKIYKILDNDRSLVDKIHGILTMHEYGMSLRVIPPTDGIYELMIYARTTGTKDSYKWVCSYQIKCLEPKRSQELPQNPFHYWGLQQKAKEFGINGFNFGGDLIMTENGVLGLTFKTSRPLLAMYELAHNEFTGSISKKCIVSHIEEKQLSCHLLLPFHGFYRLSLFVKDLDAEQFKNTANLLIQCKSPINHNDLFPSALSNHCGPGINSKLHGLIDPSHVSPIINTKTGKCNITFHTLSDVEVFAILEKDKISNTVFSLERYCLITHLEHKTSISVLIPESGYYKLSIFAKSQDNQEFAHVCDYVIRCLSDNHLLPFPKLYSAWRNSYTLLQPRSGLLSAESWVNFRVKIPGACKVVLIGPVKTELQLIKNKIWEGSIFTGPIGTLIKLAVKFTQNSTTMDIVMSFITQINLNMIDGSSG
ncbi:kyphoscoliosis peptidase-like [Bombina bombina]|uniref:kyphoscoliosis peptidase-like n=1 Tax=Bombina bombina TaxID=8345 RepID=UPI00235A5295|nr:kyphoscoliosis peptidase-like [Bombina bombina]XP_053560292.1 kyphoscoliosis peptidase-like [Bombina bombina]XP_053560293.1 kyphoscoliosis peptidase-like [Bombina bombina]XP_053560294.1 kyphoscoliosis peptidase-like [Bombina bombina]